MGAVACAAGPFWPVEVIMVGFFTMREFHKLWPWLAGEWFLPHSFPKFQFEDLKRNSTRKVIFICVPMVEFGTALVFGKF